MKKRFFLGAMATLFLGILTLPAAAWIMVDPAASTGWQNYTYTAGSSGFTGEAGFLLRVDSVAPSLLLLDNLSQCAQPGNQGFEWGDFSGYTQGSGTVQEGSPVWPSGWMFDFLPWGVDGAHCTYTLNDGQYAAVFQGGIFSPPVIFPNAFGDTGTPFSIYAYLETAISLAPGQTFTFDWGFVTANSITSWDFSLFYLKDESGNVVFQDGLGQLNNPVPVPATLPLLGSGLLALWGWRRKCRRK